MKARFLAVATVSAITYGILASAAPVQYCPTQDICYQVAVPEASASSNTGNIYLQLRAPSSYSWIALGTGTRMAGANMFVIYANGRGNVTASPRLGTGHAMPRYDSATQLELLGGSSTSNGRMVANMRCGNCGSWSGGSMSLSGDATDWIAAWKEGDAINSADPAAGIQYHDDHSEWQFDLTQGTVASDANPFGTGQQADSSNRGIAGKRNPVDPRVLIMSHGILMAIVMVILFPLGSAIMPLFGSWIPHAFWQFISFLLMWAGFAVGVVSSQEIQLDLTSSHTSFGTAVVCLMTLQPGLGYLHHRYFVQNQKRGPISHAHIWYGRALMIMGVVNGGLGIALAGNQRTFVIAYSTVAGVMFVIYGADFVQELYLKELKSYKPPPVKESDSVGQVQTFSAPKAPKSPEEADLANSLKEYENMVVEVEGTDPAAAGSSTPAAVEDWLVLEDDEEEGAHH
ncbi:putative iron reductase domain protein [Durotheca rogersii]|uniref:putative iron reductase domain protein n=1 Tax=Durotheca rogersii TaxID=419775 RepID=UPI00221F88A0|nr:putative iron reductase domain protein [Durotheca rogersii]KAI5862589.1 putative iron reductase domain protein [Durotheca rogersii]